MKKYKTRLKFVGAGWGYRARLQLVLLLFFGLVLTGICYFSVANYMPEIVKWGAITFTSNKAEIELEEEDIDLGWSGVVPSRDMKVVISKAFIDGQKPVESVHIDDGGQYLNFFVNMTEIGERRKVCYNIKSLSSTKVRVLAPKIAIASSHELIMNWDNAMNNIVLQPDEEVGPYCIEMRWAEDVMEQAQANLTAYINYEQEIK